MRRSFKAKKQKAPKANNMVAQMKEMQAANDKAWSDMKSGFDNAWDNIAKAFDRAMSRFK